MRLTPRWIGPEMLRRKQEIGYLEGFARERSLAAELAAVRRHLETLFSMDGKR